MRNDILYGIGMLLAASGVQAHDGRVYVSGTITDNTCSLSPGSENINVAMGAVSQRQFYRAGDGSAWQPFAIDLQNCGSTASGVTVSFSVRRTAVIRIYWRLPQGKATLQALGLRFMIKIKL